MKLFGEFLVERNIVSPESLLAALIEQISPLPSICEIVHKHNLMSSNDILKALSYQARNSVEFKRACQELNLWTEELSKKVENELNAIRKPLVQILLKAGSVNIESVTRALDDFLSGIDELPSKTVSDTIEFHPIPPAIASEYCAQLDESRKELLRSIVKSAESSTLTNLYLEVHAVRGIARLSEAKLTEQIVHRLEDYIQTFQQFQSPLDPIEFQALAALGDKVVNLVWSLRDCIEETGSEKHFWDDPVLKENFNSVVSELEKSCLELRRKKVA